MYLIDRSRNGAELREEFKVLGSTGNVYTVKIDKVPTCDCECHSCCRDPATQVDRLVL